MFATIRLILSLITCLALIHSLTVNAALAAPASVPMANSMLDVPPARGPQDETRNYSAVAELFTSQACSSCPAADSLMRQKAAADPNLLVLSYHVDYWDHLGWKDPFSTPSSTNRQRGYYTALNQRLFYTPELVVDGEVGMIGSDDNVVGAALIAHRLSNAYGIQIAQGDEANTLMALISTGAVQAKQPVDVWQVTYVPFARTLVGGGENEGRTIDNVNSVRLIYHLGTLSPASFHDGMARIDMPHPPSSHEAIAVIVQTPNYGPILAAATYRE
jgi:hypothetical protein